MEKRELDSIKLALTALREARYWLETENDGNCIASVLDAIPALEQILKPYETPDF